MNAREVVRMVLQGQKAPYVPWCFGFTVEAQQKLMSSYGINDIDELEDILQNHMVCFGSDLFEDMGNNRVKDIFGVVWDRTTDKDIGVVEGCLLPEPMLKGYEFPDPLNKIFFADIEKRIARFPDRFRGFSIGFSLFERAWTLRGMENLMMDFLDHPEFVRDLLNAIADYNIAQIKRAVTYDIDAVFFGDDWGQQHGLLMSPKIWREFIKPVLKRMYAAVHEARKFVAIHSCGDVVEVFDDLVEIGVNCFNPFQPEVMDIESLLKQYRDRLAFYGGLSTQKTLPYGSAKDVREESRYLLNLGRGGSYIFSPAHAVEGDVPIENMLTFINEAIQQQR